MGLVTEEEYNELNLRVKNIEERFSGMNYDLRSVVQSQLKDSINVLSQSETQYGIQTALCVDTVDIWKQNRVRFFCPLFHDPKAPIKSLPWAWPISPAGAFDDSGFCWVPPAGSTICLTFESGKRSSPFYLGGTWQRNRGPSGQHNWGFNIEEYYDIYEGNRGGYLAGANDESQVMPPWNTESYNGFDLESVVDFAENPEAQRRITTPNIYGLKTPEKHIIKLVDGDPKCNRKWKRLEIMSSTGNWMMFKDDHLHYCGQWAHPSCDVPDADVSCVEGQLEGDTSEDTTANGIDVNNENEIAQTTSVTFREGRKKEEIPCEGESSNSKIIGGHPSTPAGTKYDGSQKGANPYFKHEQECRPYRGPQTPQNNRCNLPQSGIQFGSVSGQTMIFDDSVEEPFGEPKWQRATEPFSFGCNNTFLGRIDIISATGHRFTMNDREDGEACKRHKDNGIQLLTAYGNKIKMSDHDAESCKAGDERGIFIESTAKNKIELVDQGNEQGFNCGPCRKEGGTPVPKATGAYIKVRTGYGIEMMMADENSQEETVSQYMQITCPQTDNEDRGPHILRMQEAPDGPGSIFLRAGGNYIVSTYDNKYEIVGDEEENPANSAEIVSRHKVVVVDQDYINVANRHIFVAEEQIMLMAGKDCENADGEEGPCAGPVVVFVDGCLKLSTRVFATAKRTDKNASIVMLSPNANCTDEED